MPLTSPALGSNLASRAMLLEPPSKIALSDPVTNAAVSQPMANKIAPTFEATTATTANAMMERWANMAPNQD